MRAKKKTQQIPMSANANTNANPGRRWVYHYRHVAIDKLHNFGIFYNKFIDMGEGL